MDAPAASSLQPDGATPRGETSATRETETSRETKAGRETKASQETKAPPTKPAAAPGRVRGVPSPFLEAAAERERISLFPILHPDIWRFRKKMERLRWTAQSVTFDRDLLHWKEKLSAAERFTVGMQLGFFSQIDLLVLRNLDNFQEEVPFMEARMAFAAQADQESVHMESYNLQIEALYEDAAERKKMLEAAAHIPSVGEMHAWAKRAYSRQGGRPLGERMVAAIFVEGVLFCASFAIMQWLRERNVLPGIAEVNSYIARDEITHTKLTALIERKHLKPSERASAETAARIFDDALGVVDQFVEASLPEPLIGMNATLMKQYVRFQADWVLGRLGHPPRYKAKNPFLFMDKLAINGISKANFFEEASNQYQASTKSGAMDLRLGPALTEEA